LNLLSFFLRLEKELSTFLTFWLLHNFIFFIYCCDLIQGLSWRKTHLGLRRFCALLLLNRMICICLLGSFVL
jgi:hypothetical protein